MLVLAPKSQIFYWLDDRFPRYGGLIFWKFIENKGRRPTSKHHIFELVVQSGKVRYLWKGQ